MGLVANLLGNDGDMDCKGAAECAEWWPLGVQGAMGRWTGAVCGWGAAPGMSSGGGSGSEGGWGFNLGDGGLQVEGQQTGRLGGTF